MRFSPFLSPLFFVLLLFSVFSLLGLSPVLEAELHGSFSFLCSISIPLAAVFPPLFSLCFPPPTLSVCFQSWRQRIRLPRESWLSGEVAAVEVEEVGKEIRFHISPPSLLLLPLWPGDRVAEPRRKTCNPPSSSPPFLILPLHPIPASLQQQQINTGSKLEPSSQRGRLFTSSVPVRTVYVLLFCLCVWGQR